MWKSRQMRSLSAVQGAVSVRRRSSARKGGPRKGGQVQFSLIDHHNVPTSRRRRTMIATSQKTRQIDLVRSSISMKRSLLFLFLLAALAVSKMAHAEAPEEILGRVKAVAVQAFPSGTQGYELFWVPSTHSAEIVKTLADVLKAAKREKARWVVASDSPSVLKFSLLAAFEASSTSRRVRTEIVVVSPLSEDSELVDAAKRVGASLEFLVLPAPAAEEGSGSLPPAVERGSGAFSNAANQPDSHSRFCG